MQRTGFHHTSLDQSGRRAASVLFNGKRLEGRVAFRHQIFSIGVASVRKSQNWR